MIKISFDDIFTTTNSLIVHGCNAQGVMGSGFAAEVKIKFPGAFSEYVKMVNEYSKGSPELLGKVSYYNCEYTNSNMIANAITQQHYGRDTTLRYVNYKAVQDCFRQIAAELRQTPVSLINSVRFPQIGAGLGNGDWSIISQIITNELRDIEQDLVLHLRE
jgi:O-acetyl-ADP-ribose deacetylase (regulator of RNase III)